MTDTFTRPTMTPGRALLVRLLELYAVPGYELTRLEIQKLTYFLQAAGEPLRLMYAKHRYGPYAENLNQVLHLIEGHYIRGFAERGQGGGITLLPGAVTAAQPALEDRIESRLRIARVAQLIRGFETPYGMELLATVHWVARETPEAAHDRDAAVRAVHEWSERKRTLFKPASIRRAWQRLHDLGWLGPPPVPQSDAAAPRPARTAIRLPVGVSDFRKLRQEGLYYADKTAFIKEIIDMPAQVLLLQRPRRFGKSLALSMLRAYFEKGAEDAAPLFSGLTIWEAGAVYRRHLGRHPVISLSFRGTQALTWERCLVSLQGALGRAYGEHRYLLKGDALHKDEQQTFQAVLERRASEPECWDALQSLVHHLRAHHGEDVVVLADEYDVPVQAGLSCRYLAEVTEFLRNLFVSGLKDNPHVYRAVLAGASRVAEEEIFTGLPAAGHGAQARPFATAVGFTQAEVAALAAALLRPEAADVLRSKGEGQAFGGEVVYSPGTVLGLVQGPGAQHFDKRT